MTEATQTITKFDRAYGGLQHVSLKTKASTIKHVQEVTGKTETFIIQTLRHEVREGTGKMGDYIFIECIDDTGVVRIALPPKVSDLIASQHDSLTRASRTASSRRVMAERMANGWVPSFKKRGKAK